MNRLTNYVNILVGVLLCCGGSLKAESPDYSDYARLLSTYVVKDGVYYAAWAENEEDVAALKAFVTELGQTDIESLSEADQTALFINLYNAAMVQMVLKNYPLKSVKSIGMLPFSVFKKDFIRLGDRKVSLDEIEKGILLKHYFDARIHFAVNCASESCPPLRTEPFLGSRLNAQLEEQTRLFAESEHAAQMDKEEESTAYSELFKWYADDFEVENPAEYLNPYRKTVLPTNYSVDWISYDWSLNEVTED